MSGFTGVWVLLHDGLIALRSSNDIIQLFSHQLGFKRFLNTSKMGEKKTATMACTFCRKRKRRCDGQKPCSMCIKYNKADCEYPVDKDRRKWKFDSTYVDYLELKADLMEQLVDELVRENPEKAQLLGFEKLKADLNELQLNSAGNPNNNKVGMSEEFVKNLADEEAIDELVNTKWRVRQKSTNRDITEFYGPISGRQKVDESLEKEDQFIGASTKFDLVSSSAEFRSQLLDNFAKSFARYFLASWQTLDEVRTWEYPSQDVSKQLLMCAIFTYGASFSNHRDLAFTFLQEAEFMTMKASKNINEYVLQAFLILSCFQLGMGLDANSWAYCVMSASMTQYMGLHLMPTMNSTANNTLVPYRGKSSAMFWSIILQDRIITSVLGRGCRIQYFRVQTDFYKPLLRQNNLEEYITEVSFAFHTKLWFIHDKFLGQIYSSKAEFLHASHRLSLIQQGVEALQELQNSLPEDFKLSYVITDTRILTLHLSFSVVYLLLHRAYLKQMPLKVINTMMQQCEISADLIGRLTAQFESNEDIPYFASYLVLTCATFDLFLMTNKDESLRSRSADRLKIYITCLVVIGRYWRRGVRDIQVLSELAKRWKINVPCLEEALSRQTNSFGMSEMPNDQRDANCFMDQFPL